MLRSSQWSAQVNQDIEVHNEPSRILVQVTIYRRLRIGRDSHLDQSSVFISSDQMSPMIIAIFEGGHFHLYLIALT